MKYQNEHLREISFPIGGIGSGCIGLDGNGELNDWEIYNRPNKGSDNGYTHMAIRLRSGGNTILKVLHSDVTKDLTGQYSNGQFNGFGFGVSEHRMCGFPHFRHNDFIGEYPIATLPFYDEDFPGTVTLTAFNPMIPLDSKNSSLPAAFFEIAWTNETGAAAEFDAIFSLSNPYLCSENRIMEQGNLTSVLLRNAGVEETDVEYGDLSVSCMDPSEVQAYWYRGNWKDAVQTYWNELSSGKPFLNRTYDEPGKWDTCSVMQSFRAEAGETVRARFVLSWNVPNAYNYWHRTWSEEEKRQKKWRTYYSTQFENSAATGRYALLNWEELYRKTLAFKNELFATTVDEAIIDAVSATMSVLKSATVMRLENGEFYGFEGCHEKAGSCEGTCQHVWNYAYALCFLFPDLERSIRDLEFRYATDENGQTIFRLGLPLGTEPAAWFACLDGQMGCVIKTYREWKISGDDAWLRSHWETVKKVLEYAWSPANAHEWDRDRDGVLEGRQHHTLDMELFGPSSWLEGFYLAALKAASEMADYLGEADKAKEYLDLFERGRKWSRENLFNGSYFIQKIDLEDKSIPEHFGCADQYWNEEVGEIKYQIGEGSEIDQLCGQWHAVLCGLGELFDEDQVKTALRYLYDHSFKRSMRDFVNPWRVFAINDESGTVICDYPAGCRQPKIPLPYFGECMHGFEYQLAGMFFAYGMEREGLEIVRSVRDRYNGSNRNPWNEIECGSNYARSMASFALLPILSGFTFDLPRGVIGFSPKKIPFRSFWSLGTGWGNVVISESETELHLLSGELSVGELRLPYLQSVRSVTADGRELPFTFRDGAIRFDKTTVRSSLQIRS